MAGQVQDVKLCLGSGAHSSKGQGVIKVRDEHSLFSAAVGRLE